MLKVLDFGLAKVVTAQPERDQLPQMLSGTPLYMPPEASAAPQTIDARSDLYSLGAVAYYLLTGTDVFSGTDIMDVLRQHVSTQPDNLSQRLGLPINPGLESIVLQCLAKDPANRPQSAPELSRRLLECPADKTGIVISCGENALSPTEGTVRK